MKIGKNLNTGTINPQKLFVTKEKDGKSSDRVTLGETSPDMSFLMDKKISGIKSSPVSRKTFGRIMGGFAGVSTGVIAGLAIFGALSPTGALYAATGLGATMAISSAVYYNTGG